MPTGRRYIIQLVDRYTAPMRRVTQATKKFGNSLKGAQSAVAGLGGIMAIRAIGRPLLDFQTAMNKVKAVSGSSAAAMKELSGTARELGRTTTFTAGQSAQAMSELAVAGLKTNEILKFMPDVLALAAAGTLDLRTAAESATDIHKAFGLALEDFTHVTDALAWGAANASTSVLQIGGGLRNVGPMAKAANVSLDETVALLMGLAQGGVKGEEAGTQLLNMIRAIVNPTKKATGAFRQYGIRLKDFVEKGRIKDLTGLLAELKSKKVDPSGLFKMLEIRGGKAAAVLTTMIPDIQRFTSGLRDATGAGKTMAEIMLEGFPGDLKRMQSAFESLVITMAGSMLPVWTDFLKTSTELFGWIEKSSPALLKWGGMFLMISTAITAVLAPLAALSFVIGAINLPLLGIVAALSAAVAGIILLAKTWQALKSNIIGAFTTPEATSRAEMGGRIEVAAAQGSVVTAANLSVNGGDNLAFMGGA